MFSSLKNSLHPLPIFLPRSNEIIDGTFYCLLGLVLTLSIFLYAIHTPAAFFFF